MKRLFCALAGAALALGLATPAQAENIFIVRYTLDDPSVEDAVNNLQAICFAGDTVTMDWKPPASLAGYDQIWDLRIAGGTFVMPDTRAAYTSYLQAGGRMFVFGENSSVSFMPRNNSILSWIKDDLGGGALTFYYGYIPGTPTGKPTQTVEPPFDSTPNNVASVTYDLPGGVTSPGTGQWITYDAANNAGTAVLWKPGTLANAPAGSLVVVFDINFMNSSAFSPQGAPPPYPYGSPELLGNLCGKKVNAAPPPAITITTQPSGKSVTEGTVSGSLSVTATVNPTGTALSYQWYSNTTPTNSGGTPIAGATGNTFTLPAGLTEGTYYYYVVVSAPGATSVASNAVTVKVGPKGSVPSNSAPTTVPTMGEWALALLALLLAGLGFGALRRGV